ncbi:MAG: aminopeptidase P N-terminal domain-containing protein, partial [Salinivirgaceae bacterium]
MRHQELPESFFARNRKQLLVRMGHNELGIVFSNPVAFRNADQQFIYRQSSDLFYLTGITQPESVLLIGEEVNAVGEALFISKPDTKTELWDGHQLTTEEAQAISGIEHVFYIDDLKDVLSKLSAKTQTILSSYALNHAVADRWMSELLKLQPSLDRKDFGATIAQLRVIKKPEEIQLIQKAVRITAAAFGQLLPNIQPDTREYAIEAEMIRTFIANGADGHAFDPIVASGANSCTLHYTKNNAVMNSGDLLLLDFGAEYNGYAADMSRTVPVSGSFTARQREVYQAVLDAQKAAIGLIKPGVTIKEINKATGRFLEQRMVDLDLLKQSEVDNQPTDAPLYKKYFMHGTC